MISFHVPKNLERLLSVRSLITTIIVGILRNYIYGVDIFGGGPPFQNNRVLPSGTVISVASDTDGFVTQNTLGTTIDNTSE